MKNEDNVKVKKNDFERKTIMQKTRKRNDLRLLLLYIPTSVDLIVGS
jgi:hypothetical protein